MSTSHNDINDLSVATQALSDLIEKMAGENDDTRAQLFCWAIGFLQAKKGRVRD